MTYCHLGKGFLDHGDLVQAERCLNNASEHFIRLGEEPAEAAVLRQLATVYEAVTIGSLPAAAWNEPSSLTSDIGFQNWKPISRASPTSAIPDENHDGAFTTNQRSGLT